MQWYGDGDDGGGGGGGDGGGGYGMAVMFGAIRGPRPSADGPGHTRMAWDPSMAWPQLTNQKTI